MNKVLAKEVIWKHPVFLKLKSDLASLWGDEVSDKILFNDYEYLIIEDLEEADKILRAKFAFD